MAWFGTTGQEEVVAVSKWHAIALLPGIGQDADR